MDTQGIKDFAQFLEAHPDVPAEMRFTNYNLSRPEVICEMIANGFHVDIRDTIVYLRRTFLSLTVEYVVAIHDMCDPAIVDGKIVWPLKPEFARLRPDADARVEESCK
jgi:hypothetical protein